MDKRASPINRDFYIHFGQRLTLFRKKRGYNQQELAFILGVSYQQYQKYEKGTSRMPLDRVVIVKNLFNVTYEKLLD